MKLWILLIKRELQLAIRGGYLSGIISLSIILIFLLSAMFPALNAENTSILFLVVQSITITLFAHHIFRDDYQDSCLDQLQISGHSNLLIITAKLFSYWMLNAFLSAICITTYILLYKTSINQLYFYSIILLISSLILTSIAMLASSLTINIDRGEILILLIATPLSLAFLLYSTSLLSSYEEIITITTSSLLNIKILAAFCLITVPVAIIACSYAISEIQLNR